MDTNISEQKRASKQFENALGATVLASITGEAAGATDNSNVAAAPAACFLWKKVAADQKEETRGEQEGKKQQEEENGGSPTVNDVAIAAEVTEDEIARREAEFRDRLMNEVPAAVHVKEDDQRTGIATGCWSKKRNQCLLITSLLAIIAGAAIAFLYTRHNSEARLQEKDAIALAQETGRTFEYELNKAYGPLFSLAQIVRGKDELWGIADEVGQAGEPGSLPLRQDRLRDDRWPTHRNMSGSPCVDEATYDEFALVASELKKSANMDGVLVSIQLAPHAVVCFAYPLINEEDFAPPLVLDNRHAIGHDLLSDPARSFIAEQTVPADGLVLAGPLTLVQCNGEENCHPILENALIARLPIVSDTHQMTVKGEPYNRWGFAVALINWIELVERSGVFQKFDQLGMDFLLSKTDRHCNKKTGECKVETKIFAETPLYQTHSLSRTSVTVDLDTTSNQWKLTVVYQEDQTLNYVWVPIVIAFAVAAMLHLALFSKEICGLAQKDKTQKECFNVAIANKELNPVESGFMETESGFTSVTGAGSTTLSVEVG